MQTILQTKIPGREPARGKVQVRSLRARANGWAERGMPASFADVIERASSAGAIR